MGIALFEPKNEGLDHALLHRVIIDVVVLVINGFVRVGLYEVHRQMHFFLEVLGIAPEFAQFFGGGDRDVILEAQEFFVDIALRECEGMQNVV